MITGGTGSFDNNVLKRFLSTAVREIRIYSRDEKLVIDRALDAKLFQMAIGYIAPV